MRVDRVGEARFERGRAADDVLRLRRVLHARQFDHDAVGALLLDHRLGHAEFVHAVMQRGDVLLERGVLHGFLHRRRERADQLHAAVWSGLRGPLEFADAAAQLLGRRVRRGLVGEIDHHRLVDAVHAAVADVVVAQQRARVRSVGIELLVQRAGHVDLQQEVHAAAQIETEVHRQRVQGGQPARRRALQVQRDDELRVGRVAVQRLLQQVLHAQLRVGVRQTHADVRVGRRVVERDVVRLDLIGGERRFDRRQRGRVELDRCLAARHLHRRRFAEQIGQRVHEADDQSHQHHGVFPEGVTIHEWSNGKVGLEAMRPAMSAGGFSGVLREPPARPRRTRESRPYSDLIVPFGRIVVTDAFCTVISVPSEISTPT